MRALAWLEQFIQDIRFGARNLSKSPGFTAIAMLSLALGIGASTAIYSVVYAVVLNPFPYKDVDTLMSVKVWEPGKQGYRTGYTTDQFLEIAERNSIFEAVIASTISDVLWSGQGEPQRLRGNHVTRDTFSVMGVPPLIGRVLVPSDFDPDSPPVCVLGYRFWQRQFGGAPSALGRQLRLNGTIRTVVGIMPRPFMWRGADVYLPVILRRGQEVEGVRYVHLLGRLKPGITEAQAEADLGPIIQELKRMAPDQFPEKWRVGLLSFKETFPSAIRQALWILFGAVGLLLLIACANVSNLLLAKAAGRQKEIAVRAALGAGRLRLIRQLLTESLLVALGGGLLGVALAYGGLKAILAIVPPGTIPDEAVIAINTPVLLYTLGICALTALIFGLAPALHSCTVELTNPLKGAGHGLTGSLRQRWLRSGLVVVEVALSLVLLVGASLMIRTVMAMGSIDVGIRTDRLLTMRIPLNPLRYPDAARRILFFQDLLDRITAIPGVDAAGLNTGMHPLGNWSVPVEVVGSTKQDQRPVLVHQINEDYMRTLGIPLLQGRLFTRNEVAGKQHLALVNQSFDRRYLIDTAPLGHIVRFPQLRSAPFNATDDSFQIVGVVKDTTNRVLANEVSPEVYLPFTITGLADRLVVLTRTDTVAISNAVRRQIYAVDPEQPVTDVRTIEAIFDEFVFAEPRFNLVLFSVFAGLGLALAVVGVYGVISHSVSQQTQEIGVRIALGAGFANIVRMVVTAGLKLLAVGIALGLAGGVAASRLLREQIWNVSPFDPLSFMLVSVVLLVVGIQACLWPALRAARTDPVIALRLE
jgi:putative ABC transport system permease protein